MQAYTVAISEQQRAIIQRALEAYTANHKPAPGQLPNDKFEALVLQQMVKSLPAEERRMQRDHDTGPGLAVHGFTV